MAVERQRAALAFLLTALLAGAVMVAPEAGAGKGGGKPNLSLKKVSGVPRQATVGDAATVKAGVKNGGSTKARKSKVSLYLSSDKRKSKGDDKLPGQKRVPNLKPGKSKNVKVKTKLNADEGDWYVIACASKAKGEKKTGNNCKASRKVAVGSPGGEPWPERYMGTFSVSFSLSQGTENTDKGQTGTEDFSGSMSGEMVLTRKPGDLLGGTSQPWHYESSGSLDWSGSYTSAFEDDPGFSQTCSGQGSGIEPVNPFAGATTQRYGWVRPDGDFSPGGSYTTFGAENSDLEFAGTCNSSDSGSSNGDRFPIFPAILPRDFNDDCRLMSGRYNVKPDGSLTGTDSCRFDYDYIHSSSGTHFVGTNTATWSWNLAPAD